MPRILLPPSCGGFADGDTKYMAERGPGSFVNIDDTDPAGKRALQKLRGQDYVAAGLVAGEEKFFAVTKDDGRWCPECHFLANRWSRECPRCKRNGITTQTIPETDMPARVLPEGPYQP